MKKYLWILTIWVLFNDGTLWQFKTGKAFWWTSSSVTIWGKTDWMGLVSNKVAEFDAEIHKGVRMISNEEIDKEHI